MDKIEFILIIIEFICIVIQMILSIYEIYLEKQSSQYMLQLKQIFNKLYGMTTNIRKENKNVN